MSVEANLNAVVSTLPPHVVLVAVSKTHPNQSIMEAYDQGQRVFGENKVQELTNKAESLPSDIKWHMIGHLQSNKVKYIVPFVDLIHGVDSLKLLTAIDKEAAKINRCIDVLLQVHIAQEESKFGFSPDELADVLSGNPMAGLPNVRIRGLMGMATFTDDLRQVRCEFAGLKQLFDKLKISFFADCHYFDTLSMGMSDDYLLAIEEGSTMVRVGSSIFGHRDYGQTL